MIAKPWMYFSKFGSPHLTSVRIAALLAGIILATGCGDSSQDEDFSGETGPITYRERDPILIALQSAGNWELAPVQATLHDPNDEWNDEWGLTSEQAAALAEADMTWYSADGTRYEALFVTDTGVTYGRRGAAPHANPPTEADSYGASADHPPPDDEMGEDDEPEDETEPLKTEQKIVPETTTREGIATPCNTDNRARISNSSTLTSMPSQMIGAMSGSGNTKSGSCSASKIGPRAALTASHCVMNASGVINTTGFLNPGQSNTSALNGSIARVGGVFLRDHRIHTRADYAVFFLQDSQAVFNLGWFGIVWGNSASAYTGITATVRGYPCGPNNTCGTVAQQCCLASPLANDQCDGWMYSHTATLGSNAYAAEQTLRTQLDQSMGMSGSPIYGWLLDSWSVLGVVRGATGPTNFAPCFGVDCYGPRFRQSMFDDVCSWIAVPNRQSAFGIHPLCHP